MSQAGNEKEINEKCLNEPRGSKESFLRKHKRDVNDQHESNRNHQENSDIYQTPNKQTPATSDNKPFTNTNTNTNSNANANAIFSSGPSPSNTGGADISTTSSKAVASANVTRKNKNINDYFKSSAYQTNIKKHTVNMINNYLNSSGNNITLTNYSAILKDKEYEIVNWKSTLLEAETKLDEIQKNYASDIEKSNNALIKLLLDTEEIKRENKKHSLHEQELRLGKITWTKTSHYQLLEVWEDGIEPLFIKKRIAELTKEKLNVEEKIRSWTLETPSEGRDNQWEISEFRLLSVTKELKKFDTQLKEFEINKSSFTFEYNWYREEQKSHFYLKWPLLHKRYQTLSLLGKGGYSEVYKAYDIKEQRYVACKLYLINQHWPREIYDNYIKHTWREIQIHQTWKHDKILKQFDSFDIDGISYCTVLEYCSGPDLGTYLKLNGTWTEAETRNIVKQILMGWWYLNNWTKKIIHYDIKPQNIWFDNSEIKISDFGISKIVDDSSQALNGSDNINPDTKIEWTSQGIGTYWYLPPECFEYGKNVKINTKVDIWSLGVITYEMIFGRKPFGHDCSQEKIFHIMSSGILRVVEFPKDSNATEECKEFIRKCLEWKIEERFSVEEALSSGFILK